MSLPSTASEQSTGHDQARWFAEEVQPHESALRSWLHSKFPTLTDVDDLVQETYARILRAHETDKLANPKAYLFTIARNAALDLFRRNRKFTIEPLVNEGPLCVIEDRPDAAEALSNSQEFEILRHAIDALPARCRQIMTLQKIQGLSNREIARRLGLSINTVNAQLVIGLMRCREYLRARGVLRGRRNTCGNR